jgi:hypothetical protein
MVNRNAHSLVELALVTQIGLKDDRTSELPTKETAPWSLQVSAQRGFAPHQECHRCWDGSGIEIEPTGVIRVLFDRPCESEAKLDDTPQRIIKNL